MNEEMNTHNLQYCVCGMRPPRLVWMARLVHVPRRSCLVTVGLLSGRVVSSLLRSARRDRVVAWHGKEPES